MATSDDVFIESRDPFESADTGFVGDTAAALRAEIAELMEQHDQIWHW